VTLDGVAQRLPPALASPLSAPSTRPRAGPGLGPTRAATQAEGALWLELPVGRCGHRDGGLQVATRLPVGGGVGGFARAVGWGSLRWVCVVAQIDDYCGNLRQV
jgi:hypothetical protein